jgi:nucleotide-binding universal stress UspA family protein
MQVDTVLVPVDGSEAALEAVEYATAVAERYEAGVHAVYLVAENADDAMANGEITAESVAEQGEEIMATVRTLSGEVPITHSSACGFSVSRLSQHPGSVILDVAETLNADFVVIPREPVTGDPEAVIEKAAEYVLAHASQPVLSV